MTLIVGIKCSDGVVVGADGAATLGSPLGNQTVMQPTSKLHYLDDHIIMGVSGQVGLAQLFRDSVPRTLRGNLVRPNNPNAAAIQRRIQQAIYEDVELTIRGAQASAFALGPQSSSLMFMTSTIIALPVQGQPTLMQFNHVGATEEASEDLPFASVGSGQPLADPFLAFLRRVYWEHKPPTVVDGIFATVWTLLNAIKLNPAVGISEPIEVGVLRLQNGIPKAEALKEDELGEYRQSVAEAEKHLSGFRERFETFAVEPPEPPTASQ